MQREKPAPELVAATFGYNPETGEIVRKASKRPDTIGPVPRIVHSNGYLVVWCLGALERAHRVAWVLMTGRWPTADIDHINRDRADNRWTNLREASRSENLRNTVVRKRAASGAKCVERKRDKFVAYTREDGKKRYLGSFATRDEASQAYESSRGNA